MTQLYAYISLIWFSGPIRTIAEVSLYLSWPPTIFPKNRRNEIRKNGDLSEDLEKLTNWLSILIAHWEALGLYIQCKAFYSKKENNVKRAQRRTRSGPINLILIF